MHAIIKEYLETDTHLYTIIEKYYNPNNFVESTFLSVCKANAGIKNLDHTLLEEIDQSIATGHADADILLLFILNSITLLGRNRTEKDPENKLISVLNSIATLLITENTPILLRILCAQIFDFSKEKVGSIEAFQEMIASVKPTHKRYRTVFLNYIYFLSYNGRLNGLNITEKQFLEQYRTSPRFGSVYFYLILNSSIIGDYVTGLKLESEYQEKLKTDRNPYLEENKLYLSFIQAAKETLQMFSGDFNPDHYENPANRYLAEITNYFVSNNIEEALNSFKKYALFSEQDTLVNNNVDYFFMKMHIHAHLGDFNEVNAILARNPYFINDFYLSDLFRIRVLIAEGKFEKAHHTLKRLLSNTERFGAINRLTHELRFCKDFTPKHLISLLNDWQKFSQQSASQRVPVKKVSTSLQGVQQLIGQSSALKNVKKLIKQYASLNETVLITGETGTGKELIAKALHQEGNFKEEAFLAINCGALTDTLLSSELFGYETGAFTGATKQKRGIFEAAGKGTVFLDEFGEISPKMQVSLLRVLESHEIRMIGGIENRQIECRIIVATNKDLRKAVVEKNFREDLYYRLQKLEIVSPALYERSEDIIELATYFLNDRSLLQERSFSEDALQALVTYHWPGNIRELKNIIDRARIFNPAKKIFKKEDLDIISKPSLSDSRKPSPAKPNLSLPTENPMQPTEREAAPPITKSSLIISRPADRITYMKELFRHHKMLTRKEIIDALKVHPITATKELQILCEEGFIIKKQPSKSPRSAYFELNTSDTNK